MVSSRLFATSRLIRVPPDIRPELPPRGWAGKKIRETILACHPALEPVFETGAGLSIMFTESEIMVAVLLRLLDEGIVALPMHDGLMAAASTGARVRQTMMDVAEEKTGCRLPVGMKEL